MQKCSTKLCCGAIAGGASALPQTPSRNWGRSPTSEGKRERRGEKGRWEKREGKGLLPLYLTSGYGLEGGGLEGGGKVEREG